MEIGGSLKIKAIIPAAGLSKKDPYHGFDGSKPKCLYEHCGEVILDKSVKLLRKHGILEIIVVVGYKGSLIKEFAEENCLKLKFVYNPNYYDGGFIDSVILGLREIPPDDVFLLVLGDVILSEDILKKLLNCDSKFCVVKHRHTWEMFAAKLSLKGLGNLSDLREYATSNAPNYGEYDGKPCLKSILPFSEWLFKNGAKAIYGRYWEIDSIVDLNWEWEKGT